MDTTSNSSSNDEQGSRAKETVAGRIKTEQSTSQEVLPVSAGRVNRASQTDPVFVVLPEQVPKLREPNREHLTHLIERYKHEDGWMCPLPWDTSVRFPPEEYYIEIDLDIYDRSGQRLRSQRARVEDLFDPVVKGALPAARVLLRGHTGFGKSTLCLKSAHDWAHGKTTFRALPWNKTLPILFKLSNLSSDMEKELFQHVRSFYNKQVETEKLETFLRELDRNLLVILDGFDELKEEGQDQVKKFLSWKNNSSVFRKASFLVSSRPTSDTNFLLLFDKHFIIRQVSQKKVERIVAAFDTNLSTSPRPSRPHSPLQRTVYLFSSCPRTQIIERRIRKYNGKKLKLKQLTPLMISFICWVINQPDFTFRDTDIIYRCIELLFKRCNEREGFAYAEVEIEDALWRFGALLSVRSQEAITSVMLETIFGKKLFTFLTLTGILKSSEKDRDGAELWEPVHRFFFETMVERIYDFSKVSSVDRKEILKLMSSQTMTCSEAKLTVLVDKTPKMSELLLSFPSSNIYVICHSDKHKLLFSDREQLGPLGHSIEICVRGTFMESTRFPTIYETFSVFRSSCRRYLDMLSFVCYQKYRCFSFNYHFPDYTEKTVGDILRPEGISVLTKLLTCVEKCGVSIILDGSAKNQSKDVTSFVLNQFFGLQIENRPEDEKPVDFFRDALEAIQKQNQKWNVDILQGGHTSSTEEGNEIHKDHTWNDISGIQVIMEKNVEGQ